MKTYFSFGSLLLAVGFVLWQIAAGPACRCEPSPESTCTRHPYEPDSIREIAFPTASGQSMLLRPFPASWQDSNGVLFTPEGVFIEEEIYEGVYSDPLEHGIHGFLAKIRQDTINQVIRLDSLPGVATSFLALYEQLYFPEPRAIDAEAWGVAYRDQAGRPGYQVLLFRTEIPRQLLLISGTTISGPEDSIDEAIRAYVQGLIDQQLDAEYLDIFRQEKADLIAAAQELQHLRHYDHICQVIPEEKKREIMWRRVQLHKRIYNAPSWSALVRPIIF